MRIRWFILVLCAGLITTSVDSAPMVTPISKEEAAAWVRYTVPLPKSITISGRVVLPPKSVVLQSPPTRDMVVSQARKELEELLGKPTGKTAFTIRMLLGGAPAEGLKRLKNSSQAYSIVPEPGNNGLRLVALTPRGLYYAAKTLQQLVGAYTTPAATVIPLVRVTDWPDMEDRGLWGADCHEHLRWLADRKMNIVEQISNIGVDAKGKGWGRLKDGREPMVTEGPFYAVQPVPVVLHLEQVSGKGVFAAYPNLKAQGGQEGTICYAQPQFVDILADWIVALASLPHAAGVDVWMSENLHGQGGCQCPECRKVDRNLQEARVILEAWRRAKARLGRDIRLYILSSEETVRSNAAILKELPREVRFWYYQWLTYNTSESPMIPDYLVEATARGQWVGVVPNLDSITHLTQPFTGAHFVHYRMNEFVDKGLSGLLGYVTPRVYFSRFNVEAAAEWSWHAKGRSPYEFALSWAVRHRIPNPKRWAEWANLIGPVEWDVYGSDWPNGARRQSLVPVAKQVREGTLPPLGQALHGIFRMPYGDIYTPEQLERDVADAERALNIAKEMGIPEYLHESHVARGYIRSLKALWDLRSLVTRDGVAAEKRDAARAAFSLYLDSLKEAAIALPEWEACVDRDDGTARWTDRPVELIEMLRAQMAETAQALGFDLKAD